MRSAGSAQIQWLTALIGAKVLWQSRTPAAAMAPAEAALAQPPDVHALRKMLTNVFIPAIPRDDFRRLEYQRALRSM